MTGQEVPSQAAPATGLTNAAGEYNCFLNVIVQCLWHCGDFRQQVRMGLQDFCWVSKGYKPDLFLCILKGQWRSG